MIKPFVLLIAVTSLVLCLGGPTTAQTVDKTPELNAGGKTIGGPGAFKGASPDTFALINSAPLFLCVTLANLGTSSVTLVFDSPLSQEVVPSGTTRTRCKSNTEVVTAVCGGSAGTACKYLWRADLAP